MKASELFKLHKVQSSEERVGKTLVGDDTFLFWINSSALDEEVDEKENYDDWCLANDAEPA